MIWMLPSARQRTIKSHYQGFFTKKALISTNEFGIHILLLSWGHRHKIFCHSQGEIRARREWCGRHEVHLNITEGSWHLL